MRLNIINSNKYLNLLSFTSFCHSICSFYFVQRDKYGVQLKLDLSFEYVNAVVCLCGESGNGWRGSVSVPYSWFQGEFDSFSSVTLKVSFPTPGFYQHTSLTAPSCFLKKKRRGKKRKNPQSSVNESIWTETKMTYHLCTDANWCCITHSCNEQRGKAHCSSHVIHEHSLD